MTAPEAAPVAADEPAHHRASPLNRPQTQTIAVIGATGRIGRAVSRAVSRAVDHAVARAVDQDRGSRLLRGLARNAAATTNTWSHFIAADRHDVAALMALIDGADVVIDLCAFDANDAQPLVAAWRASRRPPSLLIYASSLAERHRDHWNTPICPENQLRSEPAPTDSYGHGKRAARLLLSGDISAMGCQVVSLLLPQVLAADDAQARERQYLRDAAHLGYAQVTGDGTQRPCVVSVDQVAEIFLALALGAAVRAPAAVRTPAAVRPPTASPSTAAIFQVAPPHQPTLATLVEALLRGGGLPGRWRPHADRAWRGPHSGADELVDGSRLRRHLAQLPWSDLAAAHTAAGAGWRSVASNS